MVEEDSELGAEFEDSSMDCTEDYHVPKFMTHVPPSTYLLWCDCNEHANVQMTKQDAIRYPLPLIFDFPVEQDAWEKGI